MTQVLCGAPKNKKGIPHVIPITWGCLLQLCLNGSVIFGQLIVILTLTAFDDLEGITFALTG